MSRASDRFLAATFGGDELQTSEDGLRLILAQQDIDDDVCARLAASRNLRFIRHLDLRGNRISSSGVTALARSRNVYFLRSLNLADNRIGDEGLVALAASPCLMKLHSLDLSGNDVADEGALAALDRRSWLSGLGELALGPRPVDLDVWRMLVDRFGEKFRGPVAVKSTSRAPMGKGRQVDLETVKSSGHEKVSGAIFTFEGSSLLTTLLQRAVSEDRRRLVGLRDYKLARQIEIQLSESVGAVRETVESGLVFDLLVEHDLHPIAVECMACGRRYEPQSIIVEVQEQFPGRTRALSCPSKHLLFSQSSFVKLSAGPNWTEPDAHYSAYKLASSTDAGLPDPVFIGAAAPKLCIPGAEFTATLTIYTENFRRSASQKLEALGEPGDRVVTDIHPDRQSRWRSGAPVSVTLSASSFEVEPPVRVFEWSGTENIASFTVRAPRDHPTTSVELIFQVHLEGIAMALVPMKVSVSSDTRGAAKTYAHVQCPASVFASYSSKDAEPVAHRLSTLTRWAPSLDIFQDCLDLTPNEAFKPQLAEQIALRDVFILFWSRNAAASPWVQWEYQTARQQKAPEAIMPMPLEDPSIAPPPAELGELHFRDRFLVAWYGLQAIEEKSQLP
jgi:hypothetical protein